MSIIEKIIVRENKILKLNNVLIREVNPNEFNDISRLSYMMESYIKSKGNNVIGPMINYSSAVLDDNRQARITLKLIVQLKNPIYDVIYPYEFVNQVRVTNCLFARFSEKGENLHYAYSKLELYAFENDIKLKGSNYTVFVENKDNKMVADIFMEIDNGGLSVECL
ncbi:hypothetical protein [Clostridium cellulovorans]|uniref:Uncharacterized protein n=1 Tax=Clostridium cellulovorans (strain ATCC 35296 / DSM 3052 / OCM 3 / 743B) TaxID=573061 RepID=D9SW36_CLOC7|nr:hypothetical protein [Clostridium cellulovorans]ADL51180.1 hypothetical protein Clocel_1427 [Clostridium cellulovorans 743B]